ncbi:protein of unknown function [Cupriavidus neocaledonicus]|uniref:Uncharacterized protein n=1 Tax=Cupriavidus neocaledonicus TaxID=1040979 RepID=A0A375H626_9BURK|nr:protein of unknown function [Cupriavidus neocaledonicus]
MKICMAARRFRAPHMRDPIARKPAPGKGFP